MSAIRSAEGENRTPFGSGFYETTGKNAMEVLTAIFNQPSNEEAVT